MKKIKNFDPKKTRLYNWFLLLYEEQFDEQLIRTFKKAIWIKHDKDFLENGEPDKPHYHVILVVKDACTLTSLAKKFNIRDELVEPIDNMNKSLTYLVHKGYDDKYQYEVGDVVSTDEKLYNKLLSLTEEAIPEAKKAMELFDYIKEYDGYLEDYCFWSYACARNYYDAARRNSYVFMRAIDNHNKNLEKFNKTFGSGALNRSREASETEVNII